MRVHPDASKPSAHVAYLPARRLRRPDATPSQKTLTLPHASPPFFPLPASPSQLGVLPPDYKLHFCADAAAQGQCAAGDACGLAHAPSELRVPAAVRLGHLAPDYKTAVCAVHAAQGRCPEGLACHYAHGSEELRREAAVQLTLVPPSYKTTLCSNW